MRIGINDDFDLDKIIASGQCFRAGRLQDGYARFITGSHVLRMKEKEIEKKIYDVSCDSREWETVWHPYFDLSRDYSRIRILCKGKMQYIDHAMEFGKGIRILSQDPWEMLVSLIISQRKSIPAIRNCVDTISHNWGRMMMDGCEPVYSFPNPEELSAATDEALRECALGYRAPYVLDAVRKVLSGEVDLEALSDQNDEALLTSLQKIHGVGIKVASCVALFGYGRMAAAPIDVWIERAIRDNCGGQSPFQMFGEYAGMIQQYMFFYERETTKLKKKVIKESDDNKN
ncbi:MAG: DNA-3-methyladenine glycosylase 2 family protein [Blautia sp.]|nr:DNA-3-methyladenine glycosylase 2 family protein [Blautia sp.]